MGGKEDLQGQNTEEKRRGDGGTARNWDAQAHKGDQTDEGGNQQRQRAGVHLQHLEIQADHDGVEVVQTILLEGVAHFPGLIERIVRERADECAEHLGIESKDMHRIRGYLHCASDRFYLVVMLCYYQLNAAPPTVVRSTCIVCRRAKLQTVARALSRFIRVHAGAM